MKSYNKAIGSYGEQLAQDYLKKIGYFILDTNFRCKIGEIDIIAKDNDYISFIEVKSRYNTYYGVPKESVNKPKQYKIYRIAEFYILKKKLFNFKFRFDVIEVLFNYKNNAKSISLLKNAFQIDEF